MNKQPIILTVIFLLLAALGIFYFYMQGQIQPVTDDRTDEFTADESEVDNADSNKDITEDAVMMIDLAKEGPEGAHTYSIDSGVVGYVAQKRFFQNEDMVVVGTTNKVNGAGWFNPDTNIVYLEVNFDFADIASDDSQRDSDVLNLFDNTNVNLIVDEATLSGVELGEKFNTIVPATLTVNNITSEIEFDVSGVLSESVLSATGAADVLISDFNIEPPSLIDVFTVDDPIEIKFEITASNPDAVMLDKSMEPEEKMKTDDVMMEEPQ